MRTYTLLETSRFIRYVLEQEQEERRWDIWTHFKPRKQVGKEEVYMDFDEYKKQAHKKGSKHTTSKEEAADNIAFAQQFIKPRKENG